MLKQKKNATVKSQSVPQEWYPYAFDSNNVKEAYRQARQFRAKLQENRIQVMPLEQGGFTETTKRYGYDTFTVVTVFVILPQTEQFSIVEKLYNEACEKYQETPKEEYQESDDSDSSGDDFDPFLDSDDI